MKTLTRWQNKASDSVMKVSPGLLRMTKILEWNSALGRIASDTEEYDPMLEQSLQFKHHCGFPFRKDA